MKKLIGVLIVLLICSGFIFAEGQSEIAYPNKTVTIICPFPAGGLADIITRLYAKAYEDELGVPFVVVNKPGGAMIPGSMEVIGKPSDGYTMIYYSTPGMLTLPYINSSPYSYEDFEPIFFTAFQKNVLYVAADSPIQNLADFVEASKTKKQIVAVNAIGAPPQLSMAQFVMTAGLEVEYLTEGTVPKSAVSTIGGHSDAFVGQLTQLQQFPDEIRAIAILDKTGHDLLADVPTVKEALPGTSAKATSWVWGGLGVKADTPAEIKKILAEVAEKVINTKEFEKAFNASGNLYQYVGYDEAQDIVQEGVDFYYPVIDALGIKK